MTGKELIKALIKDVPLIFNDPKYPGTIEREHLCLIYAVEPVQGRQTRFRGRLGAIPIVSLDEYEFKTVFDWLEIYLPTKGLHQARNVHERLMKMNMEHPGFSSCRVWGPRRENGYVGDRFVVRMQDPQPATLYGLLRRILEHYCHEGTGPDEIPITGLELSLDIYPAKSKQFEEQAYAARRMLMTELIRKHVSIEEAFRVGKRRARFVFAEGKESSRTQHVIKAPRMTSELRKLTLETGEEKQELAALNPANHIQSYLDATFYYGSRRERLNFKCMDKFTDRRAKTDVTELPFNKTRSRIEFTLIDEMPLDHLGPASVGLTHVEDLQLRGLGGFNHLLKFDLPTFTPSEEDPNEPDETEWKIFQKTGVAGLRHYQDVSERITNTKTRRGQFSSGLSKRYSEMNARVAKALRREEERWGACWEGT